MTHEDYQELLAGRALDALDDADLRELDQHLAGCPECSAELAEWRDTAALIAYTAAQVEPRAEVGVRIMDQVRSNRAARAETSAQVIEMRQRPAAKQSSNLLRLAAAIAFVALLIGLALTWKRNADLRSENARISTELEMQRRELVQQREAITILSESGAKRMELAGTKEAENARGTFAFDPRTGRAMLMAQGLPPTPPDKAYELWFIADGRPMPGKVFTVDASGHAMMSDQVPAEARDHAVFAITLEPKDGVSSPTGPVYMTSPSS